MFFHYLLSCVFIAVSPFNPLLFHFRVTYQRIQFACIGNSLSFYIVIFLSDNLLCLFYINLRFVWKKIENPIISISSSISFTVSLTS
jgi:hypothetical protein